MSDKQLILEAISGLPEDVTFEQVLEEIEILAGLRRARQASAEGRVWTIEEVREELSIQAAIRRAEAELDNGRGIPFDEVKRKIADGRSP